MDIATLGLAVDSSRVVSAKKALDDLTTSSKGAAAAATTLEKSTTNAGKGAKALAAGTGLARHEMINLSRQMSDVGVSLVSGQSPFMVLAQQGTQIADIFGSSKTGSVGGALKQIGRGIYGFLGPIGLLVTGITAVGAAGIYATVSIAKTEKQFDDTARAIGTTVQSLHGLDAAAAIKGIDTDELLKGMQKFGASVHDAKNGMGGLAETFRANNASAKTFDDYLEKASDLIKNASTDAQRLQLLQQMGLPATMEWVKLLQQGGKGLRDAAAEAAKFGETADAQLIAKARKFDEAWNRSTKNLSTGIRNAVIEGASWLDTLGNSATRLMMKLPGIGQNVPTNILKNALKDEQSGITSGSLLTAGSDVSGFYTGTGVGGGMGARTTVDKSALQAQIQRQQPLITLLGQTPTASQAAQPSKPVERENDRDRRRLPAAA